MIPATRWAGICGTVMVVTAGLSRQAEAAVILNATKLGSNVVIAGSGSINTNGLSFGGSTTNVGSEVFPAIGTLLTGPVWPQNAGVYSGTITSPANLGTGGLILASSGSGGLVGRPGNTGLILVSQGYVSGTFFNTSSTYNNTTIAAMGLNPGTHVWSWGSGANADSITMNVIPEPSVPTVLCVGALSLLLHARRRK